MGKLLFDQYTYLHFAVGIIAYFWGIKLLGWIFIHLSFEIIENTQYGINFINNYLYFWPGGKPKPDTIINIVGDNVGALLGWLSAYYLDTLGAKFKWYSQHIES